MALAFARGVGEYGSVIFIAGNLIGVTEIAPLLIIEKLEEYRLRRRDRDRRDHARHLVRDAARDQPPAGLRAREARPCLTPRSKEAAPSPRAIPPPSASR